MFSYWPGAQVNERLYVPNHSNSDERKKAATVMIASCGSVTALTRPPNATAIPAEKANLPKGLFAKAPDRFRQDEATLGWSTTSKRLR